jgi:hypothetical protein
MGYHSKNQAINSAMSSHARQQLVFNNALAAKLQPQQQ